MSTDNKNTPLLSESAFSLVTTFIWTVAGAGVLVFTKGLNNDTTWTPAILCVGLIALFALVVYVSYSGIQRTRLADNCYYMGLIYTLISMVIVLIQIRGFTGESGSLGVQDSVKNVLNTFGIALTSTIAGIVARLILQSQPSIDEDEKMDARASIEAIAQPLEDAGRRIRIEVELIGKSFQDLRAVMGSVSEENRSNMEILKNTFEENIRRLNDSTTKVENSMTGLADKANSAKRGLDALANLEPDKLSEMAMALNELGGIAQNAGYGIEKKKSEVISEVENIVSVLESLRESYSRLRDGADSNVTALYKLHEISTNGEQNLKLASDKYISSMRRMSDLLSANIGNLENVVAAAEKAIGDLGNSAKSAKDTLVEFSRFEPARVQEVLDQYKGLATQTKEVSSNIGTGGQRLVEAFESALKSTADLTEGVNAVLSTIQVANIQREKVELHELVSDVTSELRKLRDREESEKLKANKRRRRWWWLWLR